MSSSIRGVSMDGRHDTTPRFIIGIVSVQCRWYTLPRERASVTASASRVPCGAKRTAQARYLDSGY